jgi:hypothetical protein
LSDSFHPWLEADLPIRLLYSNRLQRLVSRAIIAAALFGLGWSLRWWTASGASVGSDHAPFLLALLALIIILLCLRRATRQDGQIELAVDRLTVSDGWKSEVFLLAQCGEFKLYQLAGSDEPAGIYWEGNKCWPVAEVILTILGIFFGGVLSGLTSTRVLMGRKIAVKGNNLSALCGFLNRLRQSARSKQRVS